jgi:micrococcal nuclease
MRIARTTILILLAASAWMLGVHAAAAGGGDFVPGPVEARVERVIDGDTFEAVAHVWPGHSVRVAVRIRGVDAPEIRSRCPAEREAAQAARRALEELFGGGPVLLGNIGGGKYYGRVLADVTAHDGRPAAEVLLAGGLARSYQGGQRAAWCG